MSSGPQPDTWAREKVVQLLSDAQLTPEGSKKAALLRQISELVLNKDTALLSEFGPLLLEFQVDASNPVRSLLAEIIDKVAAAQPALLEQSLLAAARLVQDSVAVSKRAVLSSINLFRQAFAEAQASGQLWGIQPPSSSWAAALNLQTAVSHLLGSTAADAPRLQAAKFVEAAILQYASAPPPPPNLPPPLVDPSRSALELTDLLLQQLEGPSLPALPGPLAVVLLTSAGNVASRAPLLLLPRIARTLAAAAAAHPPPAGLTENATEASRRKALHGALVQIVVAADGTPQRTPEVVAGREVGVQALCSIGTAQEAETAVKAAARRVSQAAAASGGGLKRSAGDMGSGGDCPGDWSNKRPHFDPSAGVAGPPHVPGLQPQMQPQAFQGYPQQMQPQPLGGPAAPMQPFIQQPQPQQPLLGAAAGAAPFLVQQAPQPLQAPPPAAQETELMRRVLAQMGRLVEGGPADHALLAKVVSGLDPAQLVDIVISVMDRLPPVRPADDAAMDPAYISRINLARLVGAGPSPNVTPVPPQQLQQHQPHQHQQPQQQQPQALRAVPSDPQLYGAPGAHEGGGGGGGGVKAEAPRPAPAAAQGKKAEAGMSALPRPAVVTPVPATVPLTADLVLPPLTAAEIEAQRRDAVQRVLSSSEGLRNGFTRSLVARVEAAFASDAEMALQNRVLAADASEEARRADDLALQWLYCLYHRDARTAEAAGAAPGDEPPAATPYARAYLHLLRELLRAGGRDRTVTRLAVEGPHVPEAAVAFLAQLCGVADERDTAVLAEADRPKGAKEEPAAPVTPAAPLGGEDAKPPPFEATAAHGKLALIVLRDVITQRLGERARCLDVVLRVTAVAPEFQLRRMCIQMTVNQLLPVASVAGRIAAFSEACLESVAPPQPGAAAAAAAAGRAGRAGRADGAEASGSGASDEEVEWARAFVRDRLRLGLPGTPEEALRRISLQVAMCTRRPGMLRGIAETFARSPPHLHPAFSQYMPGMVKSLKEKKPLIEFIENHPRGSEPLALQLVRLLADPPGDEEPHPWSADLVAAARAASESRGEVRFLLPCLPALPRDYVRGLLTSFAKLADEELKTTLVALVQPLRDDAPPFFTPAELIVALHQLEPGKDLPLKAVMGAVDKCLHKDTQAAFPTEAVAAALQQLSELAALPLLFMRTVIQTAIGSPKLHPFLLTLLRNLVSKQVWRMNPKIWDGFLRCLKQLQPQSYPVAVLLPAPQLAEALGKFPDMRAGLRLFAGGPEAKGRVPQSALALLMDSQPQQPPEQQPPGDALQLN